MNCLDPYRKNTDGPWYRTSETCECSIPSTSSRGLVVCSVGVDKSNKFSQVDKDYKLDPRPLIRIGNEWRN